jgi:hypothetical protein
MEEELEKVISKIHKSIKHPREYLKSEIHVFKRLNEKLAMKMGGVLTSVYFFYFCVILDLAELPAVILAHSPIAWVNYISQTVIQLLALPILGFLSNTIQRNNDAKAEADHNNLIHIATEIDTINSKLDQLIKKNG